MTSQPNISSEDLKAAIKTAHDNHQNVITLLAALLIAEEPTWNTDPERWTLCREWLASKDINNESTADAIAEQLDIWSPVPDFDAGLGSDAQASGVCWNKYA